MDSKLHLRSRRSRPFSHPDRHRADRVVYTDKRCGDKGYGMPPTWGKIGDQRPVSRTRGVPSGDSAARSLGMRRVARNAQTGMLSMNRATVTNRSNLDLIEDNYRRWKDDPNAVDPTWQVFFEGYELGNGRDGQVAGTGTSEADL